MLAESILRSSGRRTALFTSPHLVDVRERIRINGRLISKAEWTKRFWEVWDKLWAAAQSAGADAGGPPLMPAYFRFLTLLALYVFVKSSEPFDAVLLEVGLGGRLDATNVVDVLWYVASRTSGSTTSSCSATRWARSRTRRQG